MIADILPYVTPGYIAAFLLTVGFLIQVFVRLNYARKFSRAGGLHAPKLANDPFTALSWLYAIGWAQATNRMLEFFTLALSKGTPECPDLVEINVTGGQRYLFTREPEHIKTILTGKFAEFGKGEEFHRVWVDIPVSCCVRMRY
jgi:hypothetical protein